MSIVGTLPYNILNGQLEDATVVMANFNFIINQVNANAASLTGLSSVLGAPSGTRIAFNQAVPPVGWTQDTSAVYGDTAMRVINSTFGGGTGGTVPWSSFNFGNTIPVTPFTLSVGQMPAHGHSYSGTTNPESAPHGHTTSIQSFSDAGVDPTGFQAGGVAPIGTVLFPTSTENAFHQHVFGGTTNTTGGALPVTASFVTPQVMFANFCIGIKS